MARAVRRGGPGRLRPAYRQALAAHANVAARAEQYKASEAFPGEQMDQLRAMGYLDLLNGITAETRIARARAKARADAPAGRPIPPGPGCARRRTRR